ncbi:MAG: bifunctional hydroxymethylpyrimidine kinase/phosphomethylpyrimidine kinase [Clostridia bacterium]
MAIEQVPRALTIAGSDSGGGAGIQADLKTMSALGVYGMTAITAVTAQNTLGVQRVRILDADFVVDQIRSVVCDIGVDAVKCGMLANAAIVRSVADAAERFDLPNLVVDPVMVAKGGDALLDEDAVDTLRDHLIPRARVITPNLSEAAVLLGHAPGDIDTHEEMKSAARSLHRLGPEWVVVKGGHLSGDAVDVAYDGNEFLLLGARRVDTRNTHGTGCTYSAAIACGLARGWDVPRALQGAKEFISWAIENALPLGRGHGPTNHFYHLADHDEDRSGEGEWP